MTLDPSRAVNCNSPRKRCEFLSLIICWLYPQKTRSRDMVARPAPQKQGIKVLLHLAFFAEAGSLHVGVAPAVEATLVEAFQHSSSLHVVGEWTPAWRHTPRVRQQAGEVTPEQHGALQERGWEWRGFIHLFDEFIQ